MMDERINLKSVEELKNQLETVRLLYEDCVNGELVLSEIPQVKPLKSAEMTDKIKLLELIGELENKLRGEEYKEKLLNGEV